MFAGVINAIRGTETDVHLVVHGKGVNNENRPSMRPSSLFIGKSMESSRVARINFRLPHDNLKK